MAKQTPPQLAKAFQLHQAGQLADAASAYRRFLRSEPTNPAGLNNLGALYLQTGDFAAAADTLVALVRMRPDDAIASCNLGYALTQLDRVADALPHLRNAVARSPGLSLAHNNLGLALARLDQPDAAIAAFARAVELDPANGFAAANLGDAWNNAGDGARAAAAFDIVLRMAPGDARALVGHALAQAMAGRLADSRAALERLTAAGQGGAMAWNMLGLICYWDGRMDEAEAAYRKALALHRDAAGSSMGIALAQLGRGDYAAGWPQWEQRPEGVFGAGTRLARYPHWDGAPLAGRLLLHGEQGLGDVIQFSRYLPLARERVQSITLLLDQHWAALAPLYTAMPGIDSIVTDAADLDAQGAPAVAARASLLSLPYLFGTTLATIPQHTPYLHAPPDKVAAWAETLRGLARPRVGLVWAVYARANQAYVTRHKSVPFELAARLLDVPGVAFVSLQKQTSLADDAVSAAVAAGKLFDRSDALRDFGDTAALIENLALVVTADTSVAHAAGALGKRVWMLDRFNTCWRWRPSAIDTPWYPTMRIFRQRRFGEWDAVIDDVAAELRAFAAGLEKM